MIADCPAGIAADAMVRDVLAGADCLIAGQVQQGYAGLLAPGGAFVTALTITLTIYVAVVGYRLLLGLTSLTLGEVVPHFIKIGIVVALATSWPGYQALVFDTLFHAPEQVADVIVRQAAGAGTASGDVFGALQAVFERLTDAASDAWAQLPPPPAAPQTQAATAPPLPFQLGAPQFVAGMLWLSALVLVAASVGVLLVARIVLALLLLLGPVFVAFALFRATRGLAEGWLRVTVKFALVPLFALPLVALAIAVLVPLLADADAPVDSVRDGPALLILLVVAVFAAVMVQAARLGGGIAGSIRLPRGDRVTMPAPIRAQAMPVDGVNPPFASRAEVIVRAIDNSTRRITLGSARSMTGVSATRRIVGPPATSAPLPDNRLRLGQGYRRLAVAPRT